MIVSADARHTLPKALVLALLVGGTGAFVNQQHQRHMDADGTPQRFRLDADPMSASGPDGTSVLPAPPSGPTVLSPRAWPATRGLPPSRSVVPARHPLTHQPTGRHRRPMPADPSPAATDSPGTHHGTGELNWSALGRCEAGGNPHAVDPSGRYGGLYQFDSGTWHRLGGTGRPQDAPAAEQTARARTLYHQRGSSPWPGCSHRVGG
jgi:hypothetical protein